MAASTGTKYFLGTGDAKKSEILFAVNSGSVKRLLIATGKTHCDNGRKAGHLVLRLGSSRLDGRAFKRKIDKGDYKAMVAGKARKSTAAGRMRAGAQINFHGKPAWCKSGKILWNADRVSFEEWKAARDDYLPPSPG
jgi:hypothetical protein